MKITKKKYFTYLYFDVTYNREDLHLISVTYHWLQDDGVSTPKQSWGNLSVISDFCFAAYYMNAPFLDCLDVVNHIVSEHTNTLKQMLSFKLGDQL